MGDPAAYRNIESKLRDLHVRLAKHPRAQVIEFHIGAPLSDADIGAIDAEDEQDDDDERESLPVTAIALARIFDGASLRWSFLCEDGVQVSGSLHIADLGTLQEAKAPSPMEDETNWPLLRVTRGMASLVNEELYFFDGDGYIKGENVPFCDALNAMIDGLGLPGWELAFWEHGVDDEDDVGCQEEFERRVAEVRAALGLPSV